MSSCVVIVIFLSCERDHFLCGDRSSLVAKKVYSCAAIEIFVSDKRDTVREHLELEFIDLIQGDMSVRKYESLFSQLYRFAHHCDEAVLPQKFIRFGYMTVLTAHRITTPVEVVESVISDE